MGGKLVLIDGHSILNRAFFGIPDLTNSEGLHTNAVYGFLNIMFKILEEEQPDYLTVAFDVSEPTFRHKMFAEYKGTRKPMAQELREQVPLIKEMLKAMGVTTIEKGGYEADDLLGTIAKQSEQKGLTVSVVSGDRDLLQLATDHIKIRIPKTKRTGTEIEDYNATEVKEKYQVTPIEFIDVKALMGDTADNIPGVPGIGEKTATAIIAQYGSIENAYAHVDELKPPRASKNLKEYYDLAQMSKTLATITFQNFFNKFDKKSGMTGTALTEEKEFRDIYGMDVIEIPTNRPVIRVDKQDAVYKTKKEKYHAVVEEVKAAHAKGQPVLVGTITIDVSETISAMLKREGIPHTVLNAKFHELEAEIVAAAGQHGAVTIATNMAGRGTDIKLDDDAKEAGGLKVIGTERHESRRIDNQLRGRSGRQGDPGESQFFISLEDDLMRLFGSEKLMDIFNTLGVPENEQIQHKMLTSAIEKAQTKIEGNNFGIRKNLLEYDQVMNDQREIIYAERMRVLNGENMRDVIFKMITDRVESCVDTCISSELPKEEWDLNELNQLLTDIIPLEPVNAADVDSVKNNKELKHLLKERAVKLYEAKETEFPEPEQFRELERVVLLKVIDRKWMDHIDDMDQLRQGIGLQAYGQRDPVVEYKFAGFDMFDAMIDSIAEETIKVLTHIKIEQKVEREQVAKATGTNKDESVAKAPKKRTSKKIQPNDPCPCGSGKKYKQCCGRKY